MINTIQNTLAPKGSIEPHSALLAIPTCDQPLYKVLTIENLLKSFSGNYLFFNRVDSYSAFPKADKNDGCQLPKDKIENLNSRFEKAEYFSAADYYDRSRARTYACCFSMENSDYIWKNYGNNSEKGKVCLVFHFGKLRNAINQIIQPESSGLEVNGIMCRQIFSVDYGIIDYVDWHTHQENEEYLQNPIRYTFLKDKSFSSENELRMCLSALGVCHYALNDGTPLEFPDSLKLAFNFGSAFLDKTIKEILYAPDSDEEYLKLELGKLGVDLTS